MSIIEKQGAIRKGLLELAVLKALAREPLYAGDVLQRLQGTVFATQEGTLYPLLARLQKEGTIAYEWQESRSGPPRKYYHLTDTGRTQVFQMEQYWRSLDEALSAL